MLGALPHRRFARTLLLAAFVHQLGACACGCLEHNAWVQTAMSLASDAGGHHHHHAPTGPTRLSDDHSHCDDQGELVYTAGRNSEDLGPPRSAPAASAFDMVAGMMAESGVTASLAEQPLLLTPGARARLQVLRL